MTRPSLTIESNEGVRIHNVQLNAKTYAENNLQWMRVPPLMSLCDNILQVRKLCTAMLKEKDKINTYLWVKFILRDVLMFASYALCYTNYLQWTLSTNSFLQLGYNCQHLRVFWDGDTHSFSPNIFSQLVSRLKLETLYRCNHIHFWSFIFK